MAAWRAPKHWPIQDRAMYRDLDWFVPFDKNPRTHPEAQIDLLSAMIKLHGPDQPIVVDEDRVILKGHGRLLAARQAGLTHFPFVMREGMTDAEKEAMRIADNQVGLLSGWDKALILEGVSSLKTAGYDIQLLGFPEAQLRGWGIQMGTAVVDPEAAPEPPKSPIVRVGDLWTLGDHRLICGDATDADTVKRLMGRASPNLMVTDPPYGVNYDPAWRSRQGVNRNTKKLGGVKNDNRVDWSAAWALFRGDVIYCWHASWFTGEVQLSIEGAGFETSCQIVWNKDRFALSRGDYHWKHEPCWYAIRKGKKHGWNGNRSQSSVWDIPARDDSGHGHGTQKPIECMKRPIENNSSAGDHVYDPFCGSGTTIIACEITARKCLAVEIDPAYVQVAIERWQRVTNRVATLDGKPFDIVARERGDASGRNRKSVRGKRRGGAGEKPPISASRDSGLSEPRGSAVRKPRSLSAGSGRRQPGRTGLWD